MKLNYNYDDEGFFTGCVPARIDPVATKHYGEQRYLLPMNATHIAIPSTVLAENQRWRFQSGEWLIFTETEVETDI